MDRLCVAIRLRGLRRLADPAGRPGTSKKTHHRRQPGRVRWDQTSTLLFVSGRWGGESLELRKVPIDGGDVSEFSPRILLGSPSLPHFDFSSDGRWLVYARETLRGDIWLLDGELDPIERSGPGTGPCAQGDPVKREETWQHRTLPPR